MLHALLALIAFWKSLIVTAHPAEHPNTYNASSNGVLHTPSRRWYSQERIDQPPDPRFTKWSGPWPWNDDCQQYKIHYCYENDHTLDVMYMPILLGIGTWSAAFDQTDIVILPDPSCNNDGCVCDKDKIADDTVIIKLGPGWEAIVGYQYGDHGDKAAGRHYLVGREHDPTTDYPPADEWDDYAAYTAAHEIGHVLGLLHEHQRPDADEHVRINCPAIGGYEDAKKDIEKVKDDEFADSDDAAKRMEKICGSMELAAKYFTELNAFLPGASFGVQQPPDLYRPLLAGPGFDFDSIMLYGSATGAGDYVPNDRNSWTLFLTKPQKRPNFPAQYQDAVFDGGSYYWYDKGISDGDIARVLQLYPKGGPAQQQGAPATRQKRDGDDATKKHWTPRKFVVPGVLTTTFKHPTPVVPSTALFVPTWDPTRDSGYEPI